MLFITSCFCISEFWLMRKGAHMAQGKIKKIMYDNGYGFIESSDGKDVFFHHTSVAEDGFERLSIGQDVDYSLDAANASKGPRAATVSPLA